MSKLIEEAEKFEAYYANICGISVDELRNKGRVVTKCRKDCDYSDCKGFNSISKIHAEEDNITIILP